MAVNVQWRENTCPPHRSSSFLSPACPPVTFFIFFMVLISMCAEHICTKKRRNKEKSLAVRAADRRKWWQDGYLLSQEMMWDCAGCEDMTGILERSFDSLCWLSDFRWSLTLSHTRPGEHRFLMELPLNLQCAQTIVGPRNKTPLSCRTKHCRLVAKMFKT